MTTRKKTTTGKGEVKKLKLKKETLKDLDSKGGKKIRGGVLRQGSNTCTCTIPYECCTPPQRIPTYDGGPLCVTAACGTLVDCAIRR